MTKYIVAFDDDDLKPWVHSFIGTSLADVQDRIINYIIDLYEFEEKLPTDYRDFVSFCREEGVYIGKIKELESDFD